MARLPESMIGDFQMETSEGFNDYMYELGVNIVTRNIANQLYPLQKIRQAEDGVVTLDTETSFRYILPLSLAYYLGTYTGRPRSNNNIL